MLALNDVCKNFGPKQVLQDISFQIERGEILSLLGPSGCGKTTLLNVILGLEQLSGGTISHEQQNISHVSMKDRGFNIVFQDFALFPHLTAAEQATAIEATKQKFEALGADATIETLADLPRVIDLLEQLVIQ